MPLCRLGRSDDQRLRPVVDAGRVARGHRPARPHDRLQFGEPFRGRVMPGMFVLSDRDRPGLATRHLDCDHPRRQRATHLCRLRPRLRAKGEGVLVGAAHLEFLGDVLAGLRHRIDAVLRLHQRVDEAPADGGVVDLRASLIGGLRLAHHQRRACHGFHAAGDDEVEFAGTDRSRGGPDGVEPRGAEPVHRRARHAVRQPGEQRRHARDVAVVLARLIGAAEDDFVDGLGKSGMARQECPYRNRGEVVGPHFRQGAAVTADRRADRIANEGVAAHASPPWARAVRACNSRSTPSSVAVGGGVSPTAPAKRTGHAHSAAT